jgi:heme oxygenase
MKESPARDGGPRDRLPFDIFRRRREATSEIHQLTETRVPVFRDGFGLDEYTQLVERFYGFWSPVENLLSHVDSLQAEPELGLESRFKSELLRADLVALHRDPSSVHQCIELPKLNDFWQGLGCLYVLEGSTLGSRVIAPQLVKILNLREDAGAAFFNAYGPSVGQRWSEFRRFVTPRVKLENADAVVLAAQQTFTCFYDWLG